MAHDVGTTASTPAPRRVLVPRTPVPSRVANVLLWAGLPWAIAFTLVMDAALTATGVPRTDRPPVLTVLLLALGWGPLVLGAFAGFVGRIPGLTWLIARTQPRLQLDEEGLTVADERGRVVRVAWPQVTEVRIQPPMTRSPVIGPGGSVVALIPGSLVTPRVEGGGETRLADEIARYRPDLMRGYETQQRAVLLVVMLVLGGIAIAGVIAFMTR